MSFGKFFGTDTLKQFVSIKLIESKELEKVLEKEQKNKAIYYEMAL